MLERLFIIALFFLITVGAYYVFKRVHMRRIGPTAGNGRPTLLYFGSDHCAACPTQVHYLDQLGQTWNGRLAIQKIDAQAEPEKANQYGIFTLPTTVIVDATGAVRQINYGLTNVHKLARQLETL